jgi:Raf kinase inhibitor-like YbhB/YbcL family protein
MNPDPIRIKSQRSARFTVALIIALLSLLVLLALSLRRPGLSTSAQSRPGHPLAVRSSSFSDGGAIPQRYTCDGAGISPNLQWSAAPGGTKSFALVMDDPDAPVDFTHWLAYNLPLDAHELTEGESTGGAMPEGSSEGTNSFGRPGYGGPCPPAGRPHRYVFQLFALDSRLDLPAGVDRTRLESAMKTHILGSGEIVGKYGR